MNQKKNCACPSWERWRKRPKGHRQPGPSALAAKGFRAKEAWWLVAELFASDKMELTVPTKTKQSQGEKKGKKKPQ